MEILHHSTAVEVLQEINGYGDVKVTYSNKSKIKEEKKSEFLEEQIRTTPPIEEEENNEKVQ